MVLYDIKPVVIGHSLIIPKRHVLDIMELSDEEVRDMHHMLRRVVPVLLRVYESTENSYDLTSQIGEYSGRSVAHLHIHVLPRRKDDKYQKITANIFEDIKLNRTNFTFRDVEAEVARLRVEFGYIQEQR